MTAPLVFVVDDEPMVREGIVATLVAAGFRAQGFACAEDFLRCFEPDEAKPHCLIVDLRMPGMGGLGLQAKLIENRVRMPVIFISAHAEITLAVQAMKSGAVDFLEKPFERERLLGCVTNVLEFERQACERIAKRSTIETRLSKLTRREREVLDLLVSAHSTKEIAVLLNIHAKTVFVHRARVMEKMQVDSLVELSRLMTGVDDENNQQARA